MPDSLDSPRGRSILGLPLLGRKSNDLVDRVSSEDIRDFDNPSLPKRRAEADFPESDDVGDISRMEQLAELPRLPKRQSGRSRSLIWSLLLCVVLPTTAVALYFYCLAADQYVAEFRFSVTESSPVIPGIPPSPTTTSPTAASGGAGTGMPIMGIASPMFGGSNASQQNYVVIDYLLSRQAVDELQRRINIRALYDDSAVRNDLWARLDKSLPMERFLRFWNRMVNASYDPLTGLATVNVRAFSAADAQLIANTMVTLSENLVNEIASRPQRDAVKFAEGEVERAKKTLQQSRDTLAAYRMKEGVIDPSGSLTINVALIQALRTQLVQLQANLATLGTQQQNSNAPMIQSLRAQIAGTNAQLKKVEGEVSKDRGDSQILSELVSKYEQLNLDLQYAMGFVVSAQQALDQARANASAQHLYLTPYVRPALPESALYPKRFLYTTLAAALFLAVWMIGLMVTRSIQEHL